MAGLFPLLRRFGIRRLIVLRKNYSIALPALRGYILTTVFWSLLEEGFLDKVKEEGTVSVDEFAADKGLDHEVLRALCEYLEGAGVLALREGDCLLAPRGIAMMAEPRGIYELVLGYGPLFRELRGLLSGRKRYGVDVAKDGGWVARGTGRLGLQFPFPIIVEVTARRGYRRVLDLKCNDGTLLVTLAEGPAEKCFGLDDDPAAVRCARSRISAAGLAGRIDVWEGDLFDTEALAKRCRDIDLVVAFDVFHEHLIGGPERILSLIGKLKATCPRAHLLIAEFCRLPRERLRSAAKPFLEHELIHNLTGQRILAESEWEELIDRTPYRLIEKRVFSLIGHGYFLLQ